MVTVLMSACFFLWGCVTAEVTDMPSIGEDDTMHNDNLSNRSSAPGDSGDKMRNDDWLNPSPSLDITAEGCECITQCAASIHDQYACDWCRVKKGCGKKEFLKDNWDYCVYPEIQDWESLTHQAKLDHLWAMLTAEDVVDKSGPTKDLLGTAAQIVTESMRTTFDNYRDVHPHGRTKVIHAQGVHCKFELTIDRQSPYTGLFASGKQVGLIRMGSAQSLSYGMFPGIALKFLRSSIRSANFVALRSTGPGGSFNFFDGNLSNHVPPPRALTALMKFDQASSCAPMVGLSDVCAYEQDGSMVGTPRFPFEIGFEPTEGVALPDQEISDEDLLRKLSSIPVGTEVFKVYAVANPTSAKVSLGRLKTTSKCVQSEFGDLRLSFRHQRMEEDFLLHPEWVSQVDFEGCTPAAQDSSQWKCPGVL